jgi:hypothetical protein
VRDSSTACLMTMPRAGSIGARLYCAAIVKNDLWLRVPTYLDPSADQQTQQKVR